MSTKEPELFDYFKSVKDVKSPATHAAHQLDSLIPNLSLCIKLLILFINSTDSDSSLERLPDDFNQYCNVILSDNLSGYPVAIEGLSQKFEAFLKKVGYLRYKNTIYWSGDSSHIGIKETTLNNLCDGILVPQKGMPKGTGARHLPHPLFAFTGFNHDLVEFLRKELRNKVHQAPNIPKRDLITYAEYVLLAYLFVVQDNLSLLSENLSIESKHNSKLATYFSKWQNRYVQTIFIEKDTNDLVELSPHIIETDWDVNNQAQSFVPKQGKILDILGDLKQFVIIGDPGLGKTTTLQFLGYHLARQDKNLPLYFPIKNFVPKRDLLSQVATYAELSQDVISSYRESGFLAFLFDGINEVLISADQVELKNQIKSLLKDYKHSCFIFTTRPSAYKNDFNIPVFELQALNDIEIIEFIQKNHPEKATTLVTELEKQPKLKELCRNPLILVILCSLIQQAPFTIPSNKGLLLKNFIDALLKREQHKNQLFDCYKYFNYLLALGLQTRIDERISFDTHYAITIISKAVEQIDPSADRSKILIDLIDIGLLTKNNNQISFTHELYQEYFAAEGILQKNLPESELQAFEASTNWEQPLILYSGLVERYDEFIGSLSERNPILALKCFESSIKNDDAILAVITKNAFINSQKVDNIKTASNGLITLLRLGEAKLFNESLASSIGKHGEIVFRLLGQISSVLVKTIDFNYLFDSISIVVNLNKSFIPSIIRNLGRRNPEEIVKIKDQLFDLFKKDFFTSIKPSFLYRFFRLIDLTSAEKVGKSNLENYCIKLCKNDNAHSIESTNTAWNLVSQFKLFDDSKFVTKVIGILVNNRKANHGFIKKLADHSPNQLDNIIIACLDSKNITCHCVGIYLSIANGKEAAFKEALEKLFIYRNEAIKKRIVSSYNDNMLAERISVIFNHEVIRRLLIEFEKNKATVYKYKVKDIKDQMIVIRIRGLHVQGKLLEAERITKNIKKDQALTVKLAFIDPFAQVVYFTEKEDPFENYYSICQLPAPGLEVRAKISYIKNDEAEAFIHDKYIGIIKDSRLKDQKLLGKKVSAIIIKLEEGRYILELAPQKVSKFKPAIEKIPQINKSQKITSKFSGKSRRESDFAFLLKNALKSDNED
ncbi:NACHT domain-containing NTPase [Mucilaginibacter sp.]|uniref:NACHT domain-containing protein n=1 Tax=Mucilaginibacter sp. TaxID=1882438 RepID=UPI0026018D99|nr:NACHT domain-containing protein [Mucilaginibacter sp.]MDB4919160.1 hypothetical protein [Mucilaginibacter sp.]